MVKNMFNDYIFYGLVVLYLTELIYSNMNHKFKPIHVDSPVIVIGTNIKSSSEQIKTASITVEIFLHKSSDTLAHSLLDYITNKPNIQSISYSKQKFMLNHKEPILINELDQIYICLLKENGSDDELSQSIEIFSYVFNVDDLRSFLKKIEYNYMVQIQNKLGDKLYYFNDISTGKINKNEYNKMPPTISFSMKPFTTNRSFKNVIGPEARMIQKRVEFFMNNKK